MPSRDIKLLHGNDLVSSRVVSVISIRHPDDGACLYVLGYRNKPDVFLSLPQYNILNAVLLNLLTILIITIVLGEHIFRLIFFTID